MGEFGGRKIWVRAAVSTARDELISEHVEGVFAEVGETDVGGEVTGVTEESEGGCRRTRAKKMRELKLMQRCVLDGRSER